jgi:hypothetical protein
MTAKITSETIEREEPSLRDLSAAQWKSGVAAWLARRLGGRRTIALMCTGYFLAMAVTYGVPRGHASLLILLAVISVFSGLFALFTMYFPPLFPTLLRTTGAGFCYNIGRIASAVGTVVFGMVSTVHDFGTALIVAGCLFLSAGLFALALPELNEAIRSSEGFDVSPEL